MHPDLGLTYRHLVTQATLWPIFQGSGINLDGIPDLNIDFSGEAKKARDATYQSGYNLMRPQLELAATQGRATPWLTRDTYRGEASIGDNGVLTALNRDQGSSNNLSLASGACRNDRQNQLYNQALAGQGTVVW